MPDPKDAHVTLAEIARIAGVGRAAVSNWRRRHDTFPAPVGGSDTSPQFSLAEVEQWLLHNGKVSEVGSRERLWPHFEALGDRAQAGFAIAEIARRVLPGDAGIAGPTGGDLPDEMRRLVDRAVQSAGRADGKAIFEFLLARWLDTHVRQIIVTPAPLADLMAAVADVFSCKTGVPGSVLDPACGTGSLLIAAARQLVEADRWSGLVLAGSELDPALASLAAARLGFASAEYGGSPGNTHGRAGPGPHIAAVDVRVGDSLRADPHDGFRADLVLCNPPFNDRSWGSEELATDPRWTYGLPPRTEPELAWVEHSLARLKPSGLAVLLLPPAVASRRAGRRIRGALLRAGAVRAVIALPAGSASPYSVSLHLWVLQAPTPTTAETRREVLLVDATASCQRPGAGPQGIDWPHLHEHVITAVRAHVAGDEVRANGLSNMPSALPAGSVAVPAMDLLDEQVDLTPARYVPDAHGSGEVRLRDDWQRFGDLLHTLSELADPLSRIDLASDGSTTATTTVGDLDRAQALTVRAGREPPADLMPLGAPSEGAVAVLTVPDLLRGGKPRSWLTADQVSRAGDALTLAEANDVVVVGVERAYRAWVQADGPIALGPQLYLLRADPELLDPWFLAGCLRAPANARRASTHTSSSSRIDVRKLHVLQLLLGEQRRYAEAFQRLATMEDALVNVQAVSAGLLRSLSNGLAAGQLRKAANAVK